jgi:hypothetical protein
MIDALIKRVSVTYKCYEKYAHRGKIVQLLVFWDRSRDGRHLINYIFFFLLKFTVKLLQWIRMIDCCLMSSEQYCNCSCFEIDREMDAILLIIDIAYGVCRIVIKSVQQCTYFLFFANLAFWQRTLPSISYFLASK